MTGANLNRLGELAKSLNEASDFLSKQLAQAEAALNELKLGVGARVDLWTGEETVKASDGTPRNIIVHTRLCYGKHDGKWGFLLARFEDGFDEPDFTDYAFLRDASRVEKLAAVEKLPDLLKVIEAEAEQVTEETTKKAAQLRQFAAGLGKLTR